MKKLSKCCDAEMQNESNQCMTCGACGLCGGPNLPNGECMPEEDIKNNKNKDA